MKLSVDRLFHPAIEAIEVDQPVRLSGELASRYPDGVHLKAMVTPIVHGVHMRGTLEGEKRETCGRCLEPFARRASIKFDETFSEDVGPDEDLYAEVAPLVDRSIDLADLVSQLLEVDEPMAAICSDSCKGICPMCGANRNATACSCEAHSIDVRLAGLARLRDELQADDKNGR